MVLLILTNALCAAQAQMFESIIQVVLRIATHTQEWILNRSHWQVHVWIHLWMKQSIHFVNEWKNVSTVKFPKDASVW